MKDAMAPCVEYRTNILTGDELDQLTEGVKGYKKRDCYRLLNRYFELNMRGRVCILYGLRRTGKTTLLFQAINDLPKEEREKAVYIKIRITDAFSDLNADLRVLRKKGYRHVFLDEITLLEDFIDSASLFSDIFAMQGMKIVMTGTDSLGFWLALAHELYDRAYTIHTTYIPFQEYSNLLGIEDIDEYICHGGTLWDVDAPFRDNESTKRYIDTAIGNNIQHSLTCCERGNYLRHLWTLYDKNELTSAINRIIESMNHKFVLRVLTNPFKSHDLGSAAQLLEKQSDDKYTDILSWIDRNVITAELMKLLEILNQENASIGITKVHGVYFKIWGKTR